MLSWTWLNIRIDFSPLLLIWFSKTTRKCRFRQLTICLWETLKSTEVNHYQRFRHLRQSKFDFTKNLINFDFVYFSVIWLLKVPRWPLWPPRCPRPSMTQNEADCHHPWTSPKSNLNTFQLWVILFKKLSFLFFTNIHASHVAHKDIHIFHKCINIY